MSLQDVFLIFALAYVAICIGLGIPISLFWYINVESKRARAKHHADWASYARNKKFHTTQWYVPGISGVVTAATIRANAITANQINSYMYTLASYNQSLSVIRPTNFISGVSPVGDEEEDD